LKGVETWNFKGYKKRDMQGYCGPFLATRKTSIEQLTLVTTTAAALLEKLQRFYGGGEAI